MINYYLMTKPGIILGNLITFAAGFLLASRGHIDLSLFFVTLVGLGFIIASACVFNNTIDRNIDKKMARTKNRAVATGIISLARALFFATTLVLFGNLILLIYTNLLTVAVADAGFFVYVVLYSLWKVRTIYGTALGSIAGATPPVVGYVAVTNHIDLGAFLLFIMLVLWQMPHFFSIALYRLDDYAAAGIPVLPVKRGILRTKVQMMLYIIAFIVVTSLFTFFHLMSPLFLVVTTLLGIFWLGLSLRGFLQQDHRRFGKEMFRFSLVLITTLCLLVPFTVL